MFSQGFQLIFHLLMDCLAKNTIEPGAVKRDLFHRLLTTGTLLVQVASDGADLETFFLFLGAAITQLLISNDLYKHCVYQPSFNPIFSAQFDQGKATLNGSRHWKPQPRPVNNILPDSHAKLPSTFFLLFINGCCLKTYHFFVSIWKATQWTKGFGVLKQFF